MPVPSGLTVAVVFGGRSVEHDVSIITGLQACETLAARHKPVPVYIDREGRWFSGEALRELSAYTSGANLSELAVTLDAGRGAFVSAATKGRGIFGRGGEEAQAWRPDVVLNATHGTQGEDGALEGLLELADVPYVGPSLESAVLAMNKVVTKSILRVAEIPVLDDLVFRREEYEAEGGAALAGRIRSRFGFPVYIKPASLGSSVGVSRCVDEDSTLEALELAFELDRVVLVEPAVEGGSEINCAVIGRPGVAPRSSACEQPVSSDGFLSFEDKYMRGGGGAKGGGAKGADGAAKSAPAAATAPAAGAKGQGMASLQRIIPAPISDEQTATIRDLAERSFTALGCAGVARVDTLLDSYGHAYVNEVNTIPGSFAFYLWEPVGMPFADLMDELLALARDEFAEKKRSTRTFATNLLAARSGGAKA